MHLSYPPNFSFLPNFMVEVNADFNHDQPALALRRYQEYKLTESLRKFAMSKAKKPKTSAEAASETEATARFTAKHDSVDPALASLFASSVSPLPSRPESRILSALFTGWTHQSTGQSHIVAKTRTCESGRD